MNQDIRTFKTYNELKAAHQAEVNAFPLGFAFTEEAFKKMMRDWDLKDDGSDNDKICNFYNLGFIRKCDIPAYNELTKKHKEELKLFQTNKQNLIKQLEYEMNNHEYKYSGDIECVLNACGFSASDYKNNKDLQEAVNKARKNYYLRAV